jgi:hypothetical protein
MPDTFAVIETSLPEDGTILEYRMSRAGRRPPSTQRRIGRILFIAVFAVLALAGVAYGAGTFTGRDIEDGTLTGKDVKDHSPAAREFKGSLSGRRGPRGVQGPAGQPGASRAHGPQGERGVVEYRYEAPVSGKIGHGRHYADVPPIKGVFRGEGGAELSASVKTTRTEASPAVRS